MYACSCFATFFINRSGRIRVAVVYDSRSVSKHEIRGAHLCPPPPLIQNNYIYIISTRDCPSIAFVPLLPPQCPPFDPGLRQLHPHPILSFKHLCNHSSFALLPLSLPSPPLLPPSRVINLLLPFSHPMTYSSYSDRRLYYHHASMVDQGGKAQQAGLKLGDWIVELDDQLLTRWYVHVRRVACTCVQTLRAPPTKI